MTDADSNVFPLVPHLDPAAATPRPLLDGADVVCFANDWDGDPLSKKQLMTRLARSDRVLWVNSLGNRRPRASARDGARLARKLLEFAEQTLAGPRRVAENLYVLTPLAIPSFEPWVRAINGPVVAATVRLAMERLGFGRPVVWSFVPASVDAAFRLRARAVVYHCVDDYAAFSDASPEIESLERELSRRADLVITCSLPLKESRQRWNPRTVLVRHGVDHAHFARALEPLAEPDDLARLGRPRIGFFGLIADWVDLALVRRIALTYPRASVVLLGKVDTDPASLAHLDGVANVHLFGRKPYDQLPAYARGFDVAILPFARNELTRNANPLKLREYVAAGLPVVATDLPECRPLAETGAVTLAASDDAFVAEVGRWLESPERGPQAQRSKAVAGESWDAKLIECCHHIESLLWPSTAGLDTRAWRVRSRPTSWAAGPI